MRLPLVLALVLTTLLLGPAGATEQERVTLDASAARPSPLKGAMDLLPEGIPPRVLIRYLANNAQARARAEGLARLLREQGFDVVNIRESAAPVVTELHYSYGPDLASAQRLARIAGVKPSRAGLTENGLMVRPGVLQLTIAGQ